MTRRSQSFDSPRAAIRSAVELQAVYVGDQTAPNPAGIGPEVGEAIGDFTTTGPHRGQLRSELSWEPLENLAHRPVGGDPNRRRATGMTATGHADGTITIHLLRPPAPGT